MGGMTLIKHEKERKIKSQQAIAFWGDRADVYCRFASAMLSREKVLVVDLSNSSSLIIGVYGTELPVTWHYPTVSPQNR